MEDSMAEDEEDEEEEDEELPPVSLEMYSKSGW